MDDKKSTGNSQAANSNGPQPDRETLHTTDPQENMEGPVSSAMHKAGETFETGETKEQADERKDENM